MDYKTLKRHLQDNFGEDLKVPPTLGLDSFTKIIDDFLTKNNVKMLVEMPEDTQDVTVTDNIGAGSVVTFFILLKVLPPVMGQMVADMGVDGSRREGLVDAFLKMVKDELMDEG